MNVLLDFKNKFMPQKGIRGYIDKGKILTLIRTILMFTVCIGIYFIGYNTLGTNKSIWTIIAVLGILPASKSAVNMIMFFRFKSISADDFNELSKEVDKIPALYELIFTTREKAFYVKIVCCCANTVILLVDNKVQVSEIESHLLDSLAREGITGVSVKAYNDKNAYISRLNEMKSKIYSDNDTSYERVFNMFLSITL